MLLFWTGSLKSADNLELKHFRSIEFPKRKNKKKLKKKKAPRVDLPDNHTEAEEPVRQIAQNTYVVW